MRISKTALWLSVLVAFLVLFASSAGLFLNSLYARETMSWTVQTFGQDIANLVAAVALFVAVYFVNKGSVNEDILALLTEKIPPSVTGNGLLTNPVHVLDLGLLLPAMIITSILLWRRKLLGYLLAIPLLVFSILTGIGILTTFLAMSSKGLPTSLGIEAFFAIIIVVSLVLSWLFLREVK